MEENYRDQDTEQESQHKNSFPKKYIFVTLVVFLIIYFAVLGANSTKEIVKKEDSAGRSLSEEERDRIEKIISAPASPPTEEEKARIEEIISAPAGTISKEEKARIEAIINPK